MKRIAKMVSKKEDLEYLFNMDEKEACKLSTIMECFGEFGDHRRFEPYDLLTVPANTFGPDNDHKNKHSFVTTVGLWVFNKAFIEKDLVPLFGYVNTTVSKKTYKKLNKKLSQAVIEDRIELNTMKRFIIKTQKFQPYCNILSPSVTEGMLEVTDKIRNKKDELIKKNEEAIDVKKDPVTVQNIENELIKDCKDILKDDPSVDMLNYGGGADWGNNFKNMFIMKGASKESDPRNGDYAVMKSNLMDGMRPEEYTKFCDSLTGGPYARAKKTADGGAWEKMFVKGLEHLTVTPGTDCGTTRTKKVLLTDNNIDLWMYSFVVDNGKLVELTEESSKKYINKTVNIRYAGLCELETGICNICAGNLFSRLKIKNIGVACYNICSSLKNKSMKSFHDSTVKVDDMTKRGLMNIFGLR